MTPAFSKFTDPARARPQLWRLFLGVLLALAVYVPVSLGAVALGWRLSGDRSDLQFWVIQVTLGQKPLPMLTILGTFLGLLLGTFAAARLLQKRRPGTLFGRAPRVLGDFAKAAATAAILLGALSLAASFFSDWTPALAPADWLRYLPLAIPGILLQTASEEAFFRGYLQQQLAARFRTPLLWLFLPALLFGLAHVDLGTFGQKAWLIGAAAATFGLAAADLTIRTGSLGAAWGFHFANNALVLLFLSSEPRLNGLALYRSAVPATEAGNFGLLIALDIATTILVWLAIRRVVTLR